MSELANTVGVTPFSVLNATSSVIPRGSRVTLQSGGGYATTPDATTRGDFVSITDIPASGYGLATRDGIVPAIFDGNPAVDALVYAGSTAGQFSIISTSAVVMGRCVQAATSTVLGVVQLFGAA